MCNPKLKKFKTVFASSFFTSKNDDGEPCVVIDGLDNVGYAFVKKDPKLMPVELPCDNYQPKGNMEDIHCKGDRTILKIYFWC
ncbi:hypothetical protein NPIRD3C_2143 [Nitrosopumilus piranensis]|uniref:Uncharacterized protein n=1 Tax=Nitrosopumilus piranensis TaxID=1582439 RepID=A0A0C5BUB0_9ARCH|nr:hypothetical protein NPIRD3C_2143 [Nitrosopumilus piranensis]